MLRSFSVETASSSRLSKLGDKAPHPCCNVHTRSAVIFFSYPGTWFLERPSLRTTCGIWVFVFTEIFTDNSSPFSAVDIITPASFLICLCTIFLHLSLTWYHFCPRNPCRRGVRVQLDSSYMGWKGKLLFRKIFKELKSGFRSQDNDMR